MGVCIKNHLAISSVQLKTAAEHKPPDGGLHPAAAGT